jgi:hypothetical protein
MLCLVSVAVLKVDRCRHACLILMVAKRRVVQRKDALDNGQSNSQAVRRLD